MVTIDVRHPGLIAHRPGERGDEPGARRTPGRLVGLHRRDDGYGDSARDRNPPLDPDHSVVDGSGRIGPARLGYRAGLLCHDADLLAVLVDGAGARRTRPLPVAAPRGLRHRGRAGWLFALTDHLPSPRAVVHEPHHCRDDTGFAGDHHFRDVAEFPRTGHAPARTLLGSHAPGGFQRAD